MMEHILILTSTKISKNSSVFVFLGFKGTLFEGGTRVPGFVHSPLLAKKGYTSRALFHITDWFPTLLRVSGTPTSKISQLKLDGIDQFNVLFSREPQER